MNWFKKLSIVKPENQNNNLNQKTNLINKKIKNINTKKCVKCKKCSNITSIGNIGGGCCENDPKKMITNRNIINTLNSSSSSSSSSSFVRVDPEEFFHDPVHVQKYREEAEILEIITEWEIIDYPPKFLDSLEQGEQINQNFYSADCSDNNDNDWNIKTKSKQTGSMITLLSSSSNNGELDDDCHYQFECSTRMNFDDIFHAFWGHTIHNGIPITPEMLQTPTENIQKVHKRKRKRHRISEHRKHCDRTVNKKTSSDIVSDNQNDHNCDENYSCRLECNNCNSNENDERNCYNKFSDKNAERIFRLNDHGAILLNIDHIEEEQGYGFLMRRKKKLYRTIIRGIEINENYVVKRRLSVVACLKTLLKFLRDLILFGHPRNKTQCGGPGDSVRSYTLQLANDNTSTFSRNVENFISCTKESREAAPQVVMRNMRQFMNGMKNYLVKHGEGDFQQEVLKARSRLKSDEFLNLDAILETVMHQLVVLPLREHLYGMFVDYYTRSGDIQLLVENVKYACARSPVDFGIRPSVTPPTSMALNQISSLLLKLQEAELPLDKLDLFLCVIAAIFDATGCPRGQQLGADDFLPILVFVVSKCGFVGAEIEAEFMWGLLQPPLLSGEAGYYLTALCSAVHVLKSFMASDNDGTGSLDWRSSSLPACSSVLRVIIPDECNGSLQTRTLPVRPHTTTREVCRIIAHKARITNPQDYGLFKLVDGEETILTDSECPQDARIAARGKHCMLAYKRIDAKIAWPTVSPSFA